MFVLRHRFRFVDMTAVLAAVAVVAYLAFAADIFTNASHEASRPAALEIDELLLMSAVLLVGMLWAVRRLLRDRRETARRTAVEREMRTLAFNDALTGLPNRRRFDDALAAATAAPPGADAVHCVMMLDLNGFKRVNDVYGHAAGDDVLLQVGGRLSAAVRDGDVVARLGGDEFAVLATHIAGPDAATGLAHRVLESFSRPILAAGHEHAVGAAVGLALMPDDGTSPQELMRKADIALYRAKAEGISAMRFFEEHMDAHVRERDRLERELRAAMANGDIVPFFQPLVDIKSGSLRGFEVVPRWHHAALGEIGPDRFMPIAEDTGLISTLTEQLLLGATTAAMSWPSNLEMSFKTSLAALRDRGFGLKVLAILGRVGLRPDRLELQIAESALVRDLESAQRTLGELHKSGVHVALVDFGTGYSSLYHLRNFKVDRLRIDRGFVGSMTRNHESAAIVQALVGLGAGFGLEVSADGVETVDQQEMLERLGCEQGQGSFYSGPVAEQDALALINGPQGRLAHS